MKAQDVVDVLVNNIANFTDIFSSSNVEIESMFVDGDNVKVITKTPHPFKTEDVVCITKALRKTEIQSIGDGVLIVKTPHDLTTNFSKSKTITIIGTDNYDGTYAVSSIPDKFTAEFQEEAGLNRPTENKGYLLEDFDYSFNGSFIVTVIDDKTFTYVNTLGAINDAGGSPIASSKPLFSAIGSPTDLGKIYNDETTENRIVGYVNIEDTRASKDQSIESDLNYAASTGTDFRQRLINQFTLYIVVPTNEEYTGAQAKDKMDDLSIALFKCLLRNKIPSVYSDKGWSRITFVESGMADYLRSYYAHFFTFESAIDINLNNVYDGDKNVAFRTIFIEDERLKAQCELKP